MHTGCGLSCTPPRYFRSPDAAASVALFSLDLRQALLLATYAVTCNSTVVLLLLPLVWAWGLADMSNGVSLLLALDALMTIFAKMTGVPATITRLHILAFIALRGAG